MTATTAPKLTGAAKRAAGAAASKAAEAATPTDADQAAASEALDAHQDRIKAARGAIAGARSVDGLIDALTAGVALADELNAEVTDAEAHAAEDAEPNPRSIAVEPPPALPAPKPAKAKKPAKPKAAAKKAAAKPVHSQQYLVARQAQWSLAWLASHPGKLTAAGVSAAVGRDCAEGLEKLVTGDLITAWVPADGIKLYSIG